MSLHNHGAPLLVNVLKQGIDNRLMDSPTGCTSPLERPIWVVMDTASS